MVSVHPSSLIGAQAYAVQLRRQYSQEETARAINQDDRQSARSNRQDRRAAFELERGKDEGKKTAPTVPTPTVDTASAKADRVRTLATGNPTIGDVTPRSNPPARPLFSSANREAPNPNAQLRNTRPGTHLDITV